MSVLNRTTSRNLWVILTALGLMVGSVGAGEYRWCASIGTEDGDDAIVAMATDQSSNVWVLTDC